MTLIEDENEKHMSNVEENRKEKRNCIIIKHDIIEKLFIEMSMIILIERTHNQMK